MSTQTTVGVCLRSLPVSSSCGGTTVSRRHDNWTRYARPSDHGATALTRPGFPG
jgi:hypothetical protein